MNSRVPSPAHMPKSLLRKPCAIKRCAELASLGHLLCDKHEKMVPAELNARIETANRCFLDAARAGDMGGAMGALERSLLTERQIKLAIEAMEASDAADRQ